MPTACIVTGSSPAAATAGYYSLKNGLKSAHEDALTFSSAILEDECKILLNVQECAPAQVSSVIGTLSLKDCTIEICLEEQAQEVEEPAAAAPVAAPSRRGRRKA